MQKCRFRVFETRGLTSRAIIYIYSMFYWYYCRVKLCSLLTSQIRIRVGEYDFSSDKEPFPFVERAVARKFVHPKYNFFTYEYDLAMVRLDAPVQYTPHIVPICLPGSDDLLIGENATVTGWGRLSEGGTLPSVLQEVIIIIIFGRIVSVFAVYYIETDSKIPLKFEINTQNQNRNRKKI